MKTENFHWIKETRELRSQMLETINEADFFHLGKDNPGLSHCQTMHSLSFVFSSWKEKLQEFLALKK